MSNGFEINLFVDNKMVESFTDIGNFEETRLAFHEIGHKTSYELVVKTDSRWFYNKKLNIITVEASDLKPVFDYFNPTQVKTLKVTSHRTNRVVDYVFNEVEALNSTENETAGFWFSSIENPNLPRLLIIND